MPLLESLSGMLVDAGSNNGARYDIFVLPATRNIPEHNRAGRPEPREGVCRIAFGENSHRGPVLFTDAEFNLPRSVAEQVPTIDFWSAHVALDGVRVVAIKLDSVWYESERATEPLSE